MRTCRKIAMGLLVVGSLAACDEQQAIQEEKNQVEEKELIPSSDVPTYMSTKYFGGHCPILGSSSFS